MPHRGRCRRVRRRTGEVLFEEINRVGVITLNRPRQLNALSYPMIGLLEAACAANGPDAATSPPMLRGAG